VSVVYLLQESPEQTLPAAFAHKQALITACLEQRLRLIEVSTHLLKLQLTSQQHQEAASMTPAQEGENHMDDEAKKALNEVFHILHETAEVQHH